MKKNILCSLTFILFASNANATGSYIVIDGIITSISNTRSNENSFTVSVSGGVGSCKDSTIIFPLSAAGTPEVHERAYSSALTAFVSGLKVKIHNYSGDNCDTASYIRLSK
ncbi:DUF5992 family protein [uncultured Shewanella sp.]|uniref:DUF5992 family protein n=1 Tax=uncultured Shewanella sp. TaxID=173975 RepID=UPI002608DECC|nr:DUF5992 family protein [uncultured Shewanella sp.]